MEACTVDLPRHAGPRLSESPDADRAAKRVRFDQFPARHRERRQLVHRPAAIHLGPRLHPRRSHARGAGALDRACHQDVRDHADAQSQGMVHRLQLQRPRPRRGHRPLFRLQWRHTEIRRHHQRCRSEGLYGDRVQLGLAYQRTDGGRRRISLTNDEVRFICEGSDRLTGKSYDRLQPSFSPVAFVPVSRKNSASPAATIMATPQKLDASLKCARWLPVDASDLPIRWEKKGPTAAVTPNVMKLMTPTALPLALSGLTSLMMVYGIIAAPDPTPSMNMLT